MSLQRRPPQVFQFFERKGEGFPLRKHEQRVISGQLTPDLPRQLAEETFRTIPSDGNAKPFADDNAHSTRPCFSPAN